MPAKWYPRRVFREGVVESAGEHFVEEHDGWLDHPPVAVPVSFTSCMVRVL